MFRSILFLFLLALCSLQANAFESECTPPTVYDVTGGGTTCPGQSVSINLSGSQTGHSYRLRLNNTFFYGAPQAGTGAALTFNVSVSGTFTIVATNNAGGGCTATMNGSVTILVNTADADGDGIGDCNDACPDDPNKFDPGTCGCGVADTDTDSDGTADCIDGCPEDVSKIDPGICGCGVADTDTDADGTADCLDACPNDPNKIAPGQCGCGVVDSDADCDGVADCNDLHHGADDSVDNNEDGIADCGQVLSYEEYSTAWKCATNRIYVCHNGNTLCVSKNALTHLMTQGAKAGPCVGCARSAVPTAYPATELELSLFPNPATASVVLALHGAIDSPGQVRLLDQLGRVRWSETLPPGQYEVYLDLASKGLSNGLYLVEATVAGQKLTKRLVVLD